MGRWRASTTAAPLLLVLVLMIISTLFFDAVTVAADLPSCVRAKCSHCNVPFIAQMCPGACLGCAHPYAPVIKMS